MHFYMVSLFDSCYQIARECPKLPHCFALLKFANSPYKPNYTARLKLLNSDGLEYRNVNFNVVSYKMLLGFSNNVLQKSLK